MGGARLVAGAALLALACGARAETLQGALVQTYRNNPTITAARASVRALDENVAIARARSNDVRDPRPAPVASRTVLADAPLPGEVVTPGSI